MFIEGYEKILSLSLLSYSYSLVIISLLIFHPLILSLLLLFVRFWRVYIASVDLILMNSNLVFTSSDGDKLNDVNYTPHHIS